MLTFSEKTEQEIVGAVVALRDFLNELTQLARIFRVGIVEDREREKQKRETGSRHAR